jgi:hypothetical protein
MNSPTRIDATPIVDAIILGRDGCRTFLVALRDVGNSAWEQIELCTVIASDGGLTAAMRKLVHGRDFDQVRAQRRCDSNRRCA